MEGEPTYVGREVCRECHAENYELHSQHGHAHTFTLASDPDVMEKFVGRSYETDRYGTYTYEANADGLFALMPEKFGEQPFPLQYALGSGHNGITLLTLMPDTTQPANSLQETAASQETDASQGTVAIEHRASWYRRGDQLGPTPGQTHQPPETAAELFGQKHEGQVMHKCVYCHTTTGTIVDQQVVDLTANVNCEKCHGPGSEHVRQARAMPNPPPFSVGRSDWDTESEIQLCGDCHRLPATISRAQLREYPNSLTRFQPVGMLRSECFLESEGALKCTTCHNPHTTVQNVPQSQYVQTCIDCHRQETEDHVACPVSPQSGCIDCHMPAVEIDDMGTVFHDHWIRVHP